MKPLIVFLICSSVAGVSWAGQAGGPAPLSREEEQRLLQEAVAQVGNSPVDFIRAGERHLKKFPNSTLREDLQRAILKAAIDAKDHRRIIAYGEKVLERDDDTMLLDRVARAFLESDDADSARRALQYAERLEKAAEQAKANGGPRARRADAQQEIDRTVARALALQARGWGNIGDIDKAVARARKSYEVYPTGEAAREAGRWEVRAGRLQEAIEHYADAFTIPDPKVTNENRAHHRKLMGELYTKLHGSEAGLGDLILKAYDRTAQAVSAREAQAKVGNPNKDLQDAFEFRLSGLRGDSIRLADFRGKVLVLNFWATWCKPCRFEHPLLEQLKEKYKADREVAFISINTDEDRSLVQPFIEELQWSDQVYFEDGLAQFYRVSSIPTTMIFNKRGEMASRMPGFSPDRHVDLLAEKIEEARRE